MTAFTFLLIMIFYFFPTIIAVLRRHENLRRVFFFNLFLGYGWGIFAAYYYAISGKRPGTGGFIVFAVLNGLLTMIALPGLIRAKEQARVVNSASK